MVEWKGAQKIQRKVMIGWELPLELMPAGDYAGQPFSISQRYTWSMSEKATLRHHLESWRGKAFTDDDFSGSNRFNVKNILGKSCMLSIVHKVNDGTTYANISGIGALPKGMTAPSQVNKSVYFSLEKDLFDKAVLESLSDKLKETIKGSPEYREIVDGVAPQQHPPSDEFLSDDVPF
jgi:hypothetical protein